ncbi:MAG: 1,4-dihydroxy-2-naphthoate polyprenyltransferase [Pseudoclavibacter sp.]
MNFQDPSGSLTRRATFGDWLEGARLRTLPLAIAPVVAGSGVAGHYGRFNLLFVVLALAVALLLQIGVNYANDYSDGIRGTDEHRVGPARLTGGKLAKPLVVKAVAFVCFGLAAVLGLWLSLASGLWWFPIIGLVAIVAAWFYTGGSHPYGYAGLGEVAVFVFFGLVATMGTEVVQTGAPSWVGFWAAVAMGLFSCAVLMINNIRDIETDRVAGKHTLAARLGRRNANIAYLLMCGLPFVIAAVALHPDASLGWISLAAVVPVAFAVVRGLHPRSPRDQIASLKFTSLGALAFAVLLAVGLQF